MSTPRRLSTLLAVVVLMFVAGSSVVHAAPAAPPIGTWKGEFGDGSAVGLLLNGNGTCMYGAWGGAATTGTATWNPTSTGGILTLTYYNAGIESHAYYSVTWTGPDTFVLSDPYFRVVMRRVQ